jgi:hypothetical protein
MKRTKLEKKIEKIKYKLLEGKNTIEIKAANLGASPPNTSRIELVDSHTKPHYHSIGIRKISNNKSCKIKTPRTFVLGFLFFVNSKGFEPPTSRSVI